jgi:hypothetical protein
MCMGRSVARPTSILFSSILSHIWRLKSSVIWRHVDWWTVADVSEEPPAPILTARDVHKNHNTASKNNVAEKMVNSCDISENKSLKNVQAKENQNQSKQCPSDKSSKQSTSSGNETPSNHKSKFCSCVVACLHSTICVWLTVPMAELKHIVVIQIVTVTSCSLVDSRIHRNILPPSSGFNTPDNSIIYNSQGHSMNCAFILRQFWNITIWLDSMQHIMSVWFSACCPRHVG